MTEENLMDFRDYWYDLGLDLWEKLTVLDDVGIRWF